MVKVSYEQKPYRRSMIETWGASVVASPSEDTNSGRAVLEADPASPGSLGIAISEAVEDAAQHDDTAYSLGSVLNHVLMHQTVIGQEALAQMEIAGRLPGPRRRLRRGGSNFAGLAFPFLREKIGGRDIEVLACEPAACPTLTRGPFAYDFGDTSNSRRSSPCTLGHDFVPPGIHAGGLRYHGMAPLVSQLVLDGLVRAEAYGQTDVFASAVAFARTEGIIPAPESSHAIHGIVQAAAAADAEGRERTILFNLSGHGHFDLGAYDAYSTGSSRTSSSPRARSRGRCRRSSRCRNPRASSEARGAGRRAARPSVTMDTRRTPRSRCTVDSTMGRWGTRIVASGSFSGSLLVRRRHYGAAASA